MSAIHTYIATHKDDKGSLDIKDDKTERPCRSTSSKFISRCAT